MSLSQTHTHTKTNQTKNKTNKQNNQKMYLTRAFRIINHNLWQLLSAGMFWVVVVVGKTGWAMFQ